MRQFFLLTPSWGVTCRAYWLAENIGHSSRILFFLIWAQAFFPLQEGVVKLAQFADLFRSRRQIYSNFHFVFVLPKNNERPSRYLDRSMARCFDQFLGITLQLVSVLVGFVICIDWIVNHFDGVVLFKHSSQSLSKVSVIICFDIFFISGNFLDMVWVNWLGDALIDWAVPPLLRSLEFVCKKF